jgi:tetratricopeptide (TPR) repeat protein
MDDIKNVSGGTNFIEFDFNGGKARINIKGHYHFTRALEFYNSNKLAEAVQEISRCIDAEPYNQNSYYYKGYILEDIPNFSEASFAYLKSLELNPNQYWVSFRLGLCYITLKKYQEAITAFSNALIDFYDFSDPLVGYSLKKEQIYTNRAIAYANLNQSQQAISDCARAINENKDYANAYFIRGLEFIKIDKDELGEIDLRKASELNHPKADSVIAQYFPTKIYTFEQVKAYEDNGQLVLKEGEIRTSENYRRIILNHIKSNPIKTYHELIDFCRNFLNQILNAFAAEKIPMDKSKRAFIVYELSTAIAKIFDNIDRKELFDILNS